jgi:hypothetical protein
MTTTAIPSNDCQSDSDDEEFEEIGTIDYLSVEPDRHDEKIGGIFAGSSSAVVSSSGHNLEGETSSDLSDCKDNKSATNHPNQSKLRVKTSPFIRATLQELQMKRMENQAAAEKQKILQNRLRVVPWTPTASDVHSPFKLHVGSSDKIVRHTTTSLPAVRDATKRELLKLNQRYAPLKARDHGENSLEISCVQNKQTQQSAPIETATRPQHTEVSPFKLILHGISPDNNSSSSATVVTPDSTQLKRTKSDVGPKSDDVNYLFHLTQLAGYSNGAADDANVDDGTSTSHESSSSHASLVQYTSSACNSHSGEDIDSENYQQQRDDDTDTNYFSCKSKLKMGTVLQNQRLRNVLSFMKQVIIIFGIALFFAWVELAKDKIMYWLHTNLLRLSALANAWIKATKDEAIAWLNSNFQIILLSVNSTWQSACDTITTSYENTSYQMTSLVSGLIGLVKNKLTCWHRMIVQSSVSLASFMRQRSLYNIQATGEMLSSISLRESQRLGKIFGQLRQQHHSFMYVAKYLSSFAWNGLGLLYYDWIKDIDLTSIMVESWFRVQRAQLDCSLLYYDARQRFKEIHGAIALAWNSTVTVLSECRESFTKSPSLMNNEAVDEPIVFKRSKTTNPFRFRFDEKGEHYSIWNNETSASVETEVLRFERVAISPSFSLLRPPKYVHNPDQFRKNARFTDGPILNSNLHQFRTVQRILAQSNEERGNNDHALSLEVQQTRTLLRKEAGKHYDSSFPTFSSDYSNDGEDALFDVNLMDMATEVTKRLLPRRRKRSTNHS